MVRPSYVSTAFTIIVWKGGNFLLLGVHSLQWHSQKFVSGGVINTAGAVWGGGGRYSALMGEWKVSSSHCHCIVNGARTRAMSLRECHFVQFLDRKACKYHLKPLLTIWLLE